MKILLALCVLVASAGCASSNRDVGKPCERCRFGYLPSSDRSDQRAVCVRDGKALNCDRIPAECGDCARIQRRDMDDRSPAY